MKIKDARILITGANGALGEAVCGLFKDIAATYPTDITVGGDIAIRLDVASSADVAAACARIEPAAIINLAAMTDLEECERDPARTYEVNAWGVRNLVREVRARNIPFVHISTAGVFDGARPSYAECDAHEANPLSVYGKSKYAGELIARTYPRSIVVRSGWMIGGGPTKDKKFIGKILAQVRAGARDIAVVHDKAGTPSYTYDIARMILQLLRDDAYGLYHSCCLGAGTRVDIAEALVDSFGLRDAVSIRPVASSYFKDGYFAPRPPSEIIVNTLMPAHGRHFRECIAEYAKKFDWDIAILADKNEG